MHRLPELQADGLTSPPVRGRGPAYIDGGDTRGVESHDGKAEKSDSRSGRRARQRPVRRRGRHGAAAAADEVERSGGPQRLRHLRGRHLSHVLCVNSGVPLAGAARSGAGTALSAGGADRGRAGRAHL